MSDRPALAVGNHYDLSPALRSQLFIEAQHRSPDEACGFAFGYSDEGIIRYWRMRSCENVSIDRAQEFLVRQHDFVEALKVAQLSKLSLALWHSHPCGIPWASRSDIDLLLHLQEIPFIIVGVEHRLIYIYETIEGHSPGYRQAASIYVPIEG